MEGQQFNQNTDIKGNYIPHQLDVIKPLAIEGLAQQIDLISGGSSGRR